MPASLALRRATIVLPDRLVEGSVVVEGDTIADVAEGRDVVVGAGDIDLRGAFLMPGLIDLHGDDIEYEMGAKGPKASPTRMPVPLALMQSDKNCIGWGITTRYHALAYWEEEAKGRSTRLSKEIIETIASQSRDGRLIADHMVDLRYEVTGDPAYTLEMMQDPAVRMISLMDHTPGEGQFRDDAQWIAFNKSLTGWSEAELQAALDDKKARGALKAQHIARIAAEAQRRGQIIASHDDHTVEKVDAMRPFGVRITEMPVTLAAAEHARALGLGVSMAAPNIVRGGSASGNLNAADAVRAGAVDCLCTDYYLPSLLMAAFMLVAQGVCPLPRAVALVTCNPARAAGFADRGEIAPGKLADLAAVDHSTGFPLVVRTLKRGRTVFADGRVGHA